MGYRSEIAIVLWKPHYDQLVEKAKAVIDFDNSWLMSFLNDAKEKETPDETYVLLYDDWIEWYDYYSGVKFIMDFLSTHRHTFIEIGESDGDITCDIKTSDGEGDDEEFKEIISFERKIDLSFFEDNDFTVKDKVKEVVEYIRRYTVIATPGMRDVYKMLDDILK